MTNYQEIIDSLRIYEFFGGAHSLLTFVTKSNKSLGVSNFSWHVLCFLKVLTIV